MIRFFKTNSIQDAIDSQAAGVAPGHVPIDPHEKSHVEITNERLFKLENVNNVNLKTKITAVQNGVNSG